MSDRPEKALILEFDSKAASIAPAIHDWCLTHIKSPNHLLHVTMSNSTALSRLECLHVKASSSKTDAETTNVGPPCASNLDLSMGALEIHDTNKIAPGLCISFNLVYSNSTYRTVKALPSAHPSPLMKRGTSKCPLLSGASRRSRR
jgi:hypothetical protein